MLSRSNNNLLFYSIILSVGATILPMLLSLVGLDAGAQIISLIKYFLIVVSSYFLLKYVSRNHLTVSIVEAIFIVWIIYLYISAIPNIIDPFKNYLFLKKFLSSTLFLYLVPLMMIAKLDIQFLKSLFKFSYWLMVFYLIFALLFANYNNEGFTVFVEGVIILMMTWPYHAPRKRFFIVLSFVVVIVGMMLASRRNRVVYYGGGLTLAVVINILSNDSYTSRKRVSLVVLTLAMGAGLYLASDFFLDFFDKMGKGMESREGIIELFVYDFNRSPSDWVFGRGLFGEFDGGILNSEDTGLRDAIENGYYLLILKGGWIWLGLLIAISINAIYKGFFKSKNLLCRGFAMIILLYYIDMVGFGVPQVSLKYYMVFIAIAGCNTKWLRECNDKYLASEIGLKN